MDQTQIIADSFWALCVNMEHKDYEEALTIATYLSCFHEHFSDSQLDQMQITWARLDHLMRLTDDN